MGRHAITHVLRGRGTRSKTGNGESKGRSGVVVLRPVPVSG